MDAPVRLHDLKTGKSYLDVTHLQQLMINSSGFAFDPQTGQTFMINHTGVEIIRWLSAGEGREKVISRIREEYGIDEFTASQDVESFISSLKMNALY